MRGWLFRFEFGCVMLNFYLNYAECGRIYVVLLLWSFVFDVFILVCFRIVWVDYKV